MRNADARLIICSPDRNFVTVKIDSDDGIYDLGMSMPFGILRRDIVLAAKKTAWAARITASGKMPGSDRT
jgi:hypothetical protein